MREVPPGQTAVIKFNGKAEKVETDWGDKFSYKILIYSHPSYDSIPKEGIESTWQSKSQAAENLLKALESGMKRICSLCLQEVIYHKVKKYPHGLQLCCYCSDTLAELSSSVDSIFKHR